MKLKSHKGFTLIELLVVVAIIGILASVVLAALGSARSKAQDAKVKSELSQMRAQAELYYIGTGAGTYGGTETTCAGPFFTGATDDSLDKLIDDVDIVSPAVACQSTASTWAVSAELSTGTYWCVDSGGASKPTGPVTTSKCP